MKFQPRFSAIAAVAALVLIPTAAFAETLTVTDIEVEGRRRVPAQRAGARGDRFQPRRDRASSTLFPDVVAAVKGLAGLNATSIRIPTLTVSYDAPDGASGTLATTITYHDFELIGITDGVADSSSIDKMVMHPGGPGVFTIGRMSTGLLDLGGILGLYGLGGDQQGSEMKPLYEDFRIEGMTFTSDTVNCEIGPATADRFSARPIGVSFEQLLAVSAELEAAETSGKPPSPEAIAKFVEFYVDFLTAMDSTPTTVEGMSCEGTDPDGKKIALSSGPLTVGGFKPGLYPSFGVDDFLMKVVDDGWLQFSNFTWKEMDLNGPIATVLDAKDALSESWFESNWRKIIPAIEGFSLTDFSMDIPDPEKTGERLQARIEWLDLSLADYVNGIPSRIAAAGRGIEIPVPDNAEGRPLRATGIDKVLVDYDVAARWDEASHTIVVDTFALTGTDLGRFDVSGTIANARPELFSENTQLATAAAAEDACPRGGPYAMQVDNHPSIQGHDRLHGARPRPHLRSGAGAQRAQDRRRGGARRQRQASPASSANATSSATSTTIRPSCSKRAVREVMTANVVTCERRTTVDELMEQMTTSAASATSPWSRGAS
jgi:hypothetical protein